MVNDNSNTPRLLPSNASLFELGQSKSATLTNFAVVADSLSTHGGAEEGERTDAESGSFGFASSASAEFASGLVKPCANPALPILPEVVGVKDCKVGIKLSWRSSMNENKR